MKEFNKSNYGMNKNSKGIVYQYADGSRLEITFEKIAANDPSFTEEDFEKLKKFSDEMYHEEVKDDCVYHRHVVSDLDENHSSEWIASESLEDELLQHLDDEKFISGLQQAIQNLLTPTQQRRFKMFFFEGLTYREIAEAENTHLKSIWESIECSKVKIKNFLKNF